MFDLYFVNIRSVEGKYFNVNVPLRNLTFTSDLVLPEDPKDDIYGATQCTFTFNSFVEQYGLQISIEKQNWWFHGLRPSKQQNGY